MSPAEPGLTREEQITKWVEESCEASGVPVKITDPATIRRIANLLRP